MYKNQKVILRLRANIPSFECVERPLICRLFGTTPRMPCPNDRAPEQPVDPKIEREVHHFIANTRQVLV